MRVLNLTLLLSPQWCHEPASSVELSHSAAAGPAWPPPGPSSLHSTLVRLAEINVKLTLWWCRQVRVGLPVWDEWRSWLAAAGAAGKN